LKIFQTIVVLFLYCGIIYSQTEPNSNLEVINSLIKNSMKEITSGLPFEDITYSFNYKSPPEFNFLETQSKVSFSKLVSMTDQKDKAMYNLVYSISDVTTEYSDSYKDGLFGSYYVNRNISIRGSFIIDTKGATVKADPFSKSYSDTIAYDSIQKFESMTLPFTRGKKPDEPFFASLLEPAIAVGSIAVTIILFFTVRSN
jgi:hypothetical protein